MPSSGFTLAICGSSWSAGAILVCPTGTTLGIPLGFPTHRSLHSQSLQLHPGFPPGLPAHRILPGLFVHTLHNTFCFKPLLLIIEPYKFPIEKTKGNFGKEKKHSERNVLLHVLWHRQAFTFSSTRRIVNLWSHLPVKSIFVCRDVSCDKLSDVRALAARKFAITLLPSVPQCTLGNISWALSDWNRV